MKTAICDPVAFLPLYRLVAGPFRRIQDLAKIERFVRTVLLHDEILMEFEPLGHRASMHVINSLGHLTSADDVTRPEFTVGVRPDVPGFDFIRPWEIDFAQPTNINLPARLVELAKSHMSGNDGDADTQIAIRFLERVFAVLANGGSALLEGNLGRKALVQSQRFPDSLFDELDEDWKAYARSVEENGFGLRVPPVLGIVLSRAANREAIPYIILDLRSEWAAARKRIWELFDAQRQSRTLKHAEEIRQELADASKLLSRSKSEMDTRPERILWEICAMGLAGASVAALSGGKPVVGALTGAIGQAARSLPGLTHEFGKSLFGKGAFDLARHVRRAVSTNELDPLSRLLSESEKIGLIK